MIKIWEKESYTLKEIFSENKGNKEKQRDLPLISVIIATYRSQKTIESCIRSLLDQSYPNVEVIIVDARNYDVKEKELCKKIIKKYPVKYFEDGPERSIQRNRGIKEAKGGYILILDQDMYLSNDVINECFQQFKKKTLHFSFLRYRLEQGTGQSVLR